MPDIMHLITIRVSPEQVYQALATPKGIRNWWTHDAVLDSKIGGTGEFCFYERQRVTKVGVTELVPPVRMAWRTIASNIGWDGTTIAFELRPEGRDTVLRLAHRGFPQADDLYARTTTGWAYYLVSLQQYLETGKGAPHPEVDFARMLR